MAPVEGELYSKEEFVRRIDSTQPNRTQNLRDFSPAILAILCTPGDSAGVLRINNPNQLIEVIRISYKDRSLLFRMFHWSQGAEVQHSVITNFSRSIVFYGNQRIIIRCGTQEIVLRHQKGEPQEPPYATERIPKYPFPPHDRMKVEATSKRSPEETTVAVGKSK